MSISIGDWLEATVCIVVPAPRAPAGFVGRGTAADILVRSLRHHAARLIGLDESGADRARVVGYHAVSRRLYDLPSLRPLRLRAHAGVVTSDSLSQLGRTASRVWADFRGARRVLLFLSPSYAIRESPPTAELRRCAWRDGLACAGSPDGDLYAIAVRLPTSASSWSRLHALLRRLSSTLDSAESVEDQASESVTDSGIPWVSAHSCGPTHSPAMNGISFPRALDLHDAPRLLNTALAEAIFDPADRSALGDSADGFRRALLAQRERSRVPWIFNELVNEIEYRTACPNPSSSPPEVHLSVSGACNIECRFCSYTHANARRDQVTVEQIARLDFFRHVRTLRLHSGNGEPTVNRHLPEIIRRVQETFPQISMNFFTNGLLLDRPELVPAMVGGHVAWISVSLNAANRQNWLDLCQSDQFTRVCDNVGALLAEKRARRVSNPVVYGSMVLTRQSVKDLPRMPELCRRLGIDRFTAIPFFSLGYEHPDRFTTADAYHHVGEAYDELYASAVAEARRHNVSIELPRPRVDTVAAFGIESRVFHDFALTEPSDGRLGELLISFPFERPAGSFCHFLWRQAAIGSATRDQNAGADTHYLYPCLGPLASLDLARRTPFRFPDEAGFMDLWRNPLFTILREGQTRQGRCKICDACRGCDTRSPETLPSMTAMVREFATEQGLTEVP